jgi:DNA repair protein RecN (Recombination protein N)
VNDRDADPVGPGRLLELTVTDLALIDRLRLTFDQGFNVITGETGAGKSLLIDALGLALGARADTSLVRHGADTARVEALFDRMPEPLVVAREVSATGRSTARLDDATVPATRLAEEVGPLVEIHGQHDQGRLLDPRWQRDLLDAFGGLSDLRAAMAMAVGRWRENRTALDAAAMDPREMARTLDLLDHEADEIETARLRPGEAAELDARRSAAQHGEEIVRGAAAIHTALVGEGRGARDATGAAVAEARSLARVDPRFDPLAERLAGLEAEVIDAADDARRLADGVDHDPGAIADLDARVAVIHGLLRRYGDDEAAVIAHGERVAA